MAYFLDHPVYVVIILSDEEDSMSFSVLELHVLSGQTDRLTDRVQCVMQQRGCIMMMTMMTTIIIIIIPTVQQYVTFADLNPVIAWNLCSILVMCCLCTNIMFRAS